MMSTDPPTSSLHMNITMGLEPSEEIRSNCAYRRDESLTFTPERVTCFTTNVLPASIEIYRKAKGPKVQEHTSHPVLWHQIKNWSALDKYQKYYSPAPHLTSFKRRLYSTLVTAYSQKAKTFGKSSIEALLSLPSL
jgi:hypothetical protein